MFSRCFSQKLAAGVPPLRWVTTSESRAEFAIRDGDTVAFLGDSITTARTYGKIIENYTRAEPFQSRLIATDFVRDRGGDWHFLEAGPGAVAGTAHEGVFKYVAQRLMGKRFEFEGDAVGGSLG